MFPGREKLVKISGMVIAAACIAATVPVPAAKEAAPAAGAPKAERVLFLGNSITLHGPNASIGWTSNCGMAASAPEKDYVHLLLQRFTDAAGGRAPASKVANIATFERQHATFDIATSLKEHLDFKADVVILAIGENVPALATEEARMAFRKAVAGLLAALKASGAPTLVVRSCFWPNKAKDEILKQTCAEAGGIFVDISHLSADASSFARSERAFKHAGVAAHPGDKGMAGIADAIWKALRKP